MAGGSRKPGFGGIHGGERGLAAPVGEVGGKLNVACQNLNEFREDFLRQKRTFSLEKNVREIAPDFSPSLLMIYGAYRRLLKRMLAPMRERAADVGSGTGALLNTSIWTPSTERKLPGYPGKRTSPKFALRELEPAVS